MKRKGHSLKLVHEVVFTSEYISKINNLKPFLSPLGQVLWYGYLGNDFENNRIRVRQYVKIPRILRHE